MGKTSFSETENVAWGRKPSVCVHTGARWCFLKVCIAFFPLKFCWYRLWIRVKGLKGFVCKRKSAAVTITTRMSPTVQNNWIMSLSYFSPSLICNTTLYLAPEGANSVCVGLENYNIAFKFFVLFPCCVLCSVHWQYWNYSVLVQLGMCFKAGQLLWMSPVWYWHCLFGRDCV